MKKLFLLALGWLLGVTLWAQTFSGSGGTIPANNTFAATCFPITVSGVGNINASTIGLAQVCLTITHPFVDELEISLQAPDGTVVPLSIQNGGSGDNYTNTCFTATAASSIKFATPPFTGTFQPEGYLGAVNNGQNANGQWRLCVQDRRTAANAGVLNSWNLTFSNAPAPAPPAIPTCATTLSPTSTCAAAPSICDFNGLCGSTTGGSSQTWTQLTSASCFGFQNNFFVQFVASAPTASFSVWVPTSSSTFPNGGVQMLFFSGTCGSGPVNTFGCYPHILPYSAGNPVINLVTASGLTPGNTYYILIDGFGGDVSTFRLAATSGVNVFSVTPDSSSVCAGGSVTLNASGGNNVYSWSPSSGLNTTTGATVIATPSSTTTYTATSSSPLGCPINRTAVVTVNNPPQISTEPITNPQTVCQGDPFASVTLAAFTGSGSSNTVQWYSNTTPSNLGGTLIPGATLPTFQPSSTFLGTLYYYAVVTNNLGCRDTSAVVGPITVTPQIAGPVPSLGPFSTRCQGAGTVVYNSSGTTAPITYSLDPAALAAGNTIDPNTGAVTYVAGWVGQAVITSSVAGCNGPIIAVHIANTFANVVPVTSFSYSSPVCATGPNPTPTLGAGFTPGGTFSAPAGLTIDPTTGTINLATSTPGAYTVTYNVPADLASCRAAASGTASITISASVTPVTTFSYLSPVCANATNPSQTLGAGFTPGGTFSAPAGLSIDPTTGTVNLATSTPGSYTVTYNVPADPASCRAAASGTASITITAVVTPVTTFSYTSPVCTTGPNPTPTLGAGFTTGGTFSAPVGVAINSTTGVIDLTGSTPGTYSITYSIPADPASCRAAASGTASITITALVTPVTNFSYSSPVCSTGPNPTPTFGAGFTTGGTFSAPAGLAINPTTGVINLATSTLGTYTVTYTLPADPASCRAAGTGTATITINAVITPVTSFLYVSPICLNGTNASPVLAPGFTAGGTWTSVPATGISLNPTTGEINLGGSTAGNYTITYTISGLACAIGGTASSSLLVNIVPGQTAVTSFSYNSPVCNSTASQLPQLAPGFTTGGTFSSPSAGLAINNTTGQITHGVSTPGTYIVTYAVPASGCRPAATGTATITINPVVTPITGFTYASPVCQNSGTINPTLVPGFTTGGAFLAPAGLSITGATGAINTNTSTPGTYTVSYSLPPSGCNPAGTGTFSITITPVVTPQTAFSYPATVCSNGAPVAPITGGAFTFGGSYSSVPAGLSLNAGNGIVTPASSTPGTYTVTYTVPASGCNPAGSGTASVTITPVNPPVTGFSYMSPVCANTGNYTPVTATGFTSGGTFTAPAGLVIDPLSGQINSNTSTPGTYTVVYTVAANGCNPAGTSSFSITIQPVNPPVTSFSYPTSLCTADPSITPSLAAGFAAGGTFTASPVGLSINPLTGTINPGASTAGSYTVQYLIGATGCTPAGSSNVTVTIGSSSTPTIGFSYLSPVCLTTAFLGPTLPTGFTPGGTFTAPVGLSMNAATGLLNLSASNAGTYTVTYTLAPMGCVSGGSSTASITLIAPTTPVTNFTYTTPVCSNGTNPTPLPGAGFTAGGTYSAPAGVSINPTTGVINLAATTPGTYNVTYSVPAGTCALAGSSSFSITILPNTAPITTFSYATPVCGNVTTLAPTLTAGFSAGGTFSSTPGLSINPSTGEVNPSTSTPGSYTINYAVASNGCQPAGNGTAVLVIQPAVIPVVGFSYTTPVCIRSTAAVAPALVTGFTTGGQFSASPAGLSINSTTGAVNLAASTAGTYTITYTLPASGCQVAATQTASLAVVAAVTPGTNFSYGNPICAGTVASVAPVPGTGFTTGGVFSTTSALTLNPTTGLVSLTGVAAGTYPITYSFASGSTATNCVVPTSRSVNVVVLANAPLVTGFSYPSPVCTNGALTVAPQLVAGFTPGGTFSASGGLPINASTGVISLAGQAAGTYTITYQVASACASASNTATITLGDIPTPVVAPVGVCDSGTVVFQATGVGTFQWYADPALTQLVNVGSSYPVFINRDTTFYVASTLNGCRSVGFTGAQGFAVAPPIKPNLGTDTLICAGDALTLQSSTFNSTYQYLWNTGSSGRSTTVTQPGTYILTARINPPGCVSSDTVVIGLYTLCDDIYFPNAFSPNNDGLNDRFGALGNIAPVTRYTMVIYNRWGQAVFTAGNPAQRWDGTMNGKAQNPGNFTYRVEYQYRGRPRTRSGNLMLVR